MLIKELKSITKDLPEDADILMQKRLLNNETLIAPILTSRISNITDENKKQHKRLILINMKPTERRRHHDQINSKTLAKRRP